MEQQALELPIQEKLKLMDALWGSLAAGSDYESPDWHRYALAETNERYAAGEEEAVDWDAAKRRLKAE